MIDLKDELLLDLEIEVNENSLGIVGVQIIPINFGLENGLFWLSMLDELYNQE